MPIPNEVWLALIPTIPATLGVILGFVNKWNIEVNTLETKDIAEKTKEIHTQTNGNLTQLREEMIVLRGELKAEIAKVSLLEKVSLSKDLNSAQEAKAGLEVQVMKEMQIVADLKKDAVHKIQIVEPEKHE